MAEGELRCNLQSCRNVLEQNALITSCSHIFCYQHGQVSISNEHCLACGTKFKSKTDFSMADLRPTDQTKSMMLSGLNPDQVLEIASRSISFYTYQLFNENRLKDDELKRAREECENLKSYCNVLKTKYKSEIEKLQRSTVGLKKEIEDKLAELEKQREQTCQYSRLSKKLQLDLAASKRQITMLKTKKSTEDIATKQYSAPSRCEFNFKPNEHLPAGCHKNKLFESSPNLGMSKWPYARYSD